MTRTQPPRSRTPPRTGGNASTRLVSRRILILANILRRAATLRYRRLLGLPGGEWAVVAELGVLAPRSLKDLSSALGLDKTQLSRTVSSLVDRGFVERKINPANNREVQISLTHDGTKTYRRLLAAGLAANDVLLAGFSDREISSLIGKIDELTTRARHTLRSEQELTHPDEQ